MLEIALITDLHFGMRGNNLFFHNNLFRFLEEIFFPYLKEHNIRHLFILGDTWESRKIVNLATLHDVKLRFFDVLREMKINVKMIYGNHDVFYKNTNDVNSVNLLLREYKNIEVITEYKAFELFGIKIGMISWLNPSNIEDGLRWINELKADILFGHFEIDGFGEYDGGVTLTNSLFDRFEYVISGHYHIPSSNGKIFYIGNPSQTNWAEYGQKRGFTLFDSRNRQLKLIENPFDVYLKFYYDEDKIDLLTFDFSIFTNKIIKVYVNSFELLNRKKFDLFFDSVSKESYTVEIVEVDTNLYQNESKLKDIKVVDVFSSIVQYVDAITADAIDKDRITDYFKSIYYQANEIVSTTK
jgi:DNA repair exonuclease SbcCD nuclease subunit